MAVSGHIYTVLLGAAAPSTTAPVILWTSSSTAVTVVRDIVITNKASTAAIFVVLWVYQDLFYELIRANVAPNTSVHQDMRQVVPAGAVVWCYPNAQPYSVVVTGYRFNLGTGASLLPVQGAVADAEIASGNT